MTGNSMTTVIHVKEADAAVRLGVSRRTLQRWRSTGDGPAYVRIGPRCVRYTVAALAAWEAGRTYAHRAAEMTGTAEGRANAP
jgi:predicted DNA-binding transcriptional regulator AlpA